MYAYLQMGKESDAKAILDGLPALAARFDPNAITGAAPGSAGVFALAAIPARWTLERSAWAEAAALEPKASAYPYTEAMTYFARALGASHTGDLAKAKAAIDSLASIQQRLSATGEPYWAEQVAIQHLAAQAWLDLAEHRETDALARMREAVAREDATEKSAVTPGPLAPARELLGDMLMELKRPAEASAEYRATLQKEPNRRHALREPGSDIRLDPIAAPPPRAIGLLECSVFSKWMTPKCRRGRTICPTCGAACVTDLSASTTTSLRPEFGRTLEIVRGQCFRSSHRDLPRVVPPTNKLFARNTADRLRTRVAVAIRFFTVGS